MLSEFEFLWLLKASGVRAVKTDPNIEGADAVGAGTGHKITPAVLNAAKAGKGWKIEYVDDEEDNQKKKEEAQKMGNTKVFVYKKPDGNFAMTQDESIADESGSDYHEMKLKDVWSGKYVSFDEQGEEKNETFDPSTISEVRRGQDTQHTEHTGSDALHNQYREATGVNGYSYSLALATPVNLNELTGSMRGFNLKKSDDGESNLLGLLHLAELTGNHDLSKVIDGLVSGRRKVSDDIGMGDMRLLPPLDFSQTENMNQYMNKERTGEFLRRVMACKTRQGVVRVMHDTYKDFLNSKESNIPTRAPNPVNATRPAPDRVPVAEKLADKVAEKLQQGDNNLVSSVDPASRKIIPMASRIVAKKEVNDLASKVAQDYANFTTQGNPLVTAVAALMPGDSSEKQQAMIDAYIKDPNSVPKSLLEEVNQRQKSLSNYRASTARVAVDGQEIPMGMLGDRLSALARSVHAYSSTRGGAPMETTAQVHSQDGIDSIMSGLDGHMLAPGCLFVPHHKGENGGFIDTGILSTMSRHLPVRVEKDENGAVSKVTVDTPLFSGEIKPSTSVDKKIEALKGLDSWLRDGSISLGEVLRNNTVAALEGSGSDLDKELAQKIDSGESELYRSQSAYMDSVAGAVAHVGAGLYQAIFGKHVGGSDEPHTKFLSQGTNFRGTLAEQKDSIKTLLENISNFKNLVDPRTGKTGIESLTDEFVKKISGGNNVHMHPEVLENILKPAVQIALDNYERDLTGQSVMPRPKKTSFVIKQFGSYMEDLTQLPALLATLAPHKPENFTVRTASGNAFKTARGVMQDGLLEIPSGKYESGGFGFLVGIKGKDGNEIHYIGKRGMPSGGTDTSGSLDSVHVRYSAHPEGGLNTELMGTEAKWGIGRDDMIAFNYAGESLELTKLLASGSKKVTCSTGKAIKLDYTKPAARKYSNLDYGVPRTPIGRNSNSVASDQLFKNRYSVTTNCFALFGKS